MHFWLNDDFNEDLEDCKMEGGQEDDLMSPGFGDRAGDGSSVALEEKKKRPRMRMGMGIVIYFFRNYSCSSDYF